MKSYILGIGTATPDNRLSQKEIYRFMVNAHQLSDDKAHQLEILYRASGIRHRHSVLRDYGVSARDFQFYPKNDALQPFPPISRRMEEYRKEALPLCIKAVNNLCDRLNPNDDWAGNVTHLITVSCTGMYAPGLDIELMEAFQLNPSVQRTAINFMGCHAAINAIKIADTICRAEEDATVLVVCVELCTLHFQNEATGDNLLANALFADGAAAVMMKSKANGALSISPRNFVSEVEYSGRKDMAWQIGDFGFEMKLSAYVPDIIKNGIRELSRKLLAQPEFSLNAISFFAIHPGGKRILEAIEQSLGLTKAQNSAAYEVLRSFGNMSSPTVLFVLKEIWDGLAATDDGKKILSFAFGPGLTMESMLLEVNSNSNA